MWGARKVGAAKITNSDWNRVSPASTVTPRGTWSNAMHHLVGADVFADAFKETTRDPAVAFRPGERAFFFGFARGEIVNAGPRGRVSGSAP